MEAVYTFVLEANLQLSVNKNNRSKNKIKLCGNDEHKRHSMTPMRLTNCSIKIQMRLPATKSWMAFDTFCKIKKNSLARVLECEEPNWEFLRSSRLSRIIFTPYSPVPKGIGCVKCLVPSTWCGCWMNNRPVWPPARGTRSSIKIIVKYDYAKTSDKGKR